jgi:hypothetical protein
MPCGVSYVKGIEPPCVITPATEGGNAPLALLNRAGIIGGKLAASAIEALIEPFCRALGQAGDDQADIQAQPGGFDAGDDAAVSFPRSGFVRGLGKAAHGVPVLQGTMGAHSIGDGFHLGSQRLGAGQAEDIVDAIVLQAVYHLRSPIMAVATDGEADRRPVPPDPADQTAQMATGRLVSVS